MILVVFRFDEICKDSEKFSLNFVGLKKLLLNFSLNLKIF